MQRITEAALELFANEGYHATSVSKIAQKAEVSKGLIYNYYDSKEEILHAIVTGANSESEELMENIFVGSPVDQLRNVLNYLFEMLDKDFYRIKLFLSLVAQVENIEFVHRLGVDKYNRTMAILENLFQQLEYENPRAESQFITALVDGLAMQYAVLNNDLPLESIRENLFEKYNLK
jgi:AcrR family transcriptional regulator